MDEWVEADVAVAAIPTWIAGRGGIREIYDGDDDPKIRRDQSDIVYTADALAARIVAHLPIGPTDFCVDPCRGRRAFYNALPEGRRDWCELTEGRNFLTYESGRRISWIVTNPPFSDAYLDIAARSFTISENGRVMVAAPLDRRYLGNRLDRGRRPEAPIPASSGRTVVRWIPVDDI